eukprot:COSAG05_NODE_1141_length_5738_cov_29.493350_2_plen_283_part_00
MVSFHTSHRSQKEPSTILSLLTTALIDCTMSSRTTATQPYVGHVHGTTATRLNLAHGLAMTVLSTGPVGVGDAIGKTNVSFLRPALRADGVILKPCRPALRLDRYYAGAATSRQQEVWMAVSAPARAAQTGAELDGRAWSLLDGRADSMAHLGTGLESRGYWWLNIISTNLLDNTPPVRMDELWPTPARNSSFLLHTHKAHCANGSKAGTCCSLLDATLPMAVTTGGQPGATDAVRRWSLQSLAPVLPNGWVLLGDLERVSRSNPSKQSPQFTLSVSRRLFP